MYKNILLPIDVMEEGSNRLALPIALELVEAFKPKLHVMTCVPHFGMSMISTCLLYTSPSPRDLSTSRMPSSA